MMGWDLLSYEEGLRELAPCILKWRLGRDLINMYKYVKGRCKEDGARLFSVVPGGRARDDGHKLKHRRCCLNIRKRFFTESD